MEFGLSTGQTRVIFVSNEFTVATAVPLWPPMPASAVGERRHASRPPVILVARAPSLSSRAPWNLPVPVRSSPSSSVHAELEQSSPPFALPALARHLARILRVLSCATSPRPSSTSPRPRPCPNPAEIELPPSPPSPFSLDLRLLRRAPPSSLPLLQSGAR